MVNRRNINNMNDTGPPVGPQIDPNQMLTVQLPVARWNMVLQALAVMTSGTIEEIQRQCFAQTLAAPATAPVKSNGAGEGDAAAFLPQP